MTKIVANFSNGHTDEYKGKRPVTAAWMVVLPDGKLMSGHSNNLPTAQKTATAKAAEMFRTTQESLNFHYQALQAASKWAHAQPMIRAKLQKLGFKSVREHDAALAAARSAFVATCKIEVVAL